MTLSDRKDQKLRPAASYLLRKVSGTSDYFTNATARAAKVLSFLKNKVRKIELAGRKTPKESEGHLQIAWHVFKTRSILKSFQV